MSIRGLALGWLLRSLLLAAFILTTGSGLLLADDRGNVLAMRAADLEAQGRCDEVVSLHRDEAPDDARIALVAGRCQVRSRDYAGAVATLTAARELHNAPADIDLQLGMAQYHLGEHDPARESLDRARARGAEGALLELYSGLLQLQANDARAAALSFEHARRSNARAVEPVASYYAFLAWRSVNEQQRSQAALARLREEDPDGPWIEEAERILAGAGAGGGTPTWWLNAEAGLAYDSNAVVKGSGVAGVFIQGDVVDGKGDGRSLWSFDAGTKLFRTEKWSGGILGAYTGTAHFDIHEFDTHYPTVGAWLDYYLGARTTLRGRYDYGYAWVNYDPFVSRNVLSGALFQDWGNTARPSGPSPAAGTTSATSGFHRPLGHSPTSTRTAARSPTRSCTATNRASRVWRIWAFASATGTRTTTRMARSSTTTSVRAPPCAAATTTATRG